MPTFKKKNTKRKRRIKSHHSSLKKQSKTSQSTDVLTNSASKEKRGPGAPRKMTPEKIVLITERLQNEIQRFINGEWKLTDVVPVSESNSRILGGDFITIEEIALSFGITHVTLRTYVESKSDSGEPLYPELFMSYGGFLECQKSHLLKGGIKGVFPSNFTTFLLSANYGMKETQKVVVEHTDTKKLYAELDAIYAGEKERVDHQKEEMLEREKKLQDEFKEEE